MRKAIVFIVLFAFILNACGIKESVESASHESMNSTLQNESITEQTMGSEQAVKELKRIDKALNSYLWVVLMINDHKTLVKVGDVVDINLSDAEKIRAAALASDIDGRIDAIFVDRNGKVIIDKTAETGPNGYGYHGKSAQSGQVEQNCKDIFGSKANWDELQTKEQNDFYDAIKYTDVTGTYAIILDAETETEHDQESHDYRVYKEGDNFIGEVDMFFGYWGELQNNPEYSNFTITYKLVPDKKSKYGLIVKGISIRKISDKGN